MATKATKTNNAEAVTLKVTQYASVIRRNKIQAEQLKTLGLGKINAVRELQDSPSVRYLVKRLAHLVKVVAE
jgi:large subunit ribosomal protein L30